ncbi:MAG: hypothetical protein RL641_879 [Candidatus Parcubacteria bacterium]|jgi:hypothetical protein
MKFTLRKNKIKNKKTITGIFFAIACFFAVSIASTVNTVQAAEIFFGSNQKEVSIGQSFEIGVFLNTTSESLNAISGTISFSKDNFTVTDIRDGNSIVNMWVERPAISTDATMPGAVTFSGIIPGGYVGDKGYLFSIIFTAQKSGNTSISSTDETILRNDGQGTKTSITHAPLALSVISTPAGNTYTAPEDTIKPESFTPKITRDPNLYDNQYFIAFVADDKQSGIDHFEVKEGFWGKYTTAESPYVLKNQNLTSRVKVKAIDKSGNERVETVSAEHMGYKSVIFFSILILIIAFVAYRIVRSRKHGKIF